MFEQLLECDIMTATLVHYLALYVDDMFVQLGASVTSQKGSRHSWRQKQYMSPSPFVAFSLQVKQIRETYPA